MVIKNFAVGHIAPYIDLRSALHHHSKFSKAFLSPFCTLNLTASRLSAKFCLSEDHEKGAKQRGADGRVE